MVEILGLFWTYWDLTYQFCPFMAFTIWIVEWLLSKFVAKFSSSYEKIWLSSPNMAPRSKFPEISRAYAPMKTVMAE